MIFPYSHSYLITLIVPATAAIFSRQVTNVGNVGEIIDAKQTDYSSFSPFFSNGVDDPKGLSMQDQGSLVSTSEGSSSTLISADDRINFSLEPVGNFSPAQYNDFPGKTENSAIKSSDYSQQDLAFLEDSGPLPGVPEAIKEIPPAIFKIFGDTIEEFDNYGRRQWLRKVEQPNCMPGTYAFCCNLGAPNPNRVGATYPARKRKTTPEEILKRRRKCTKWGPAALGCLFTSNIFCCSCKDRRDTAYDCEAYFYQGNDNPPEPRPIPKESYPQPDPNPVEESPDQIMERGLDNIPVINQDPSALLAYDTIGRPRDKETCTDDFLLERGVAPKKQWDMPAYFGKPDKRRGRRGSD